MLHILFNGTYYYLAGGLCDLFMAGVLLAEAPIILLIFAFCNVLPSKPLGTLALISTYYIKLWHILLNDVIHLSTEKRHFQSEFINNS